MTIQATPGLDATLSPARDPISETGRTLAELLAYRRCQYDATGCYAGITHPHVLNDDPVRAELFHSRLLAALIAGRETTRMVSASPFVREVAELAIGIYTPEGDNIAQSPGIQVHIRCMGEVIQWMIEHDYEHEVGIDPGDLFWCNDPTVAGMHPADVYDIMPVFWQGELVAWVCTVIMEMDIGAVSPGCMPIANVERATDGMRFVAEKVGTNDELRHDIELKIKNSLDMADIFLLDRKGAIAANIRVRQEICRIIDEFGLDFFKEAGRELIEEERRNQIARIRQRTVPGRYRNVVPLEFYMADQPVSWLPARKDHIRLVPVEMRIERDGALVLDFEGAGEWGWHPFNATPSGMWGGLAFSAVQTLAYDGRANLGSLLPLDLRLPTGSVLNPEDVRPLATASIWAPVIDVFSLWCGMVANSYYMRGFREEMFTYRGGSGLQMAGYDQYGTRRPLLAAPTGNFGAGATGVCDGLDAGGALITAEVDLGNSEIWECFMPYLDLGRRFEPYSVGWGRFRSGASIPTTAMLHRSTETIAAGVVGGAAEYILPNLGLGGGYPGGRRFNVVLRNTDIAELIERRAPLYHELGHPASPEFERIDGEILRLHHMPPPMEVNDHDILIASVGSPGGYGDPLERDLEALRTDLEEGLADPEIAENIYGALAELDPSRNEWEVDVERTEDLRAARRRERLARAVPVEDWWRRTRERLVDGDIDAMLLEMYQSSMKMSEAFTSEFKQFWALPDAWTGGVQ